MSVPIGDGASATELLQRAELARADGDVSARQNHLIEAFRVARASGDTDTMVAAAIELPTVQGFGREPGQIPALLHEAYNTVDDRSLRARLAAGLARAWVYGGDAQRAEPFAIEAEELASNVHDPIVRADVLEAALAASWGPDQLADRIRLSARLVNESAHLADTDVRLKAHLWRLTTAWECLDVVAVQRQLRALDLLTAESGSERVAFFAASRRAMYALAVSDLDTARAFMVRTGDIGTHLAEVDIEGVERSLAADLARQTVNTAALREQAEAFEWFGKAEGIQSVQAEAAVLWLEAGELEQSQHLASQVVGDGLASVRRDVDFLLTVASLTYVAAKCHLVDLAREGALLLEPYAGRAVINAGSVSFHGVVDDYLCRACRTFDDTDVAKWTDTAVNSYRRIGATWWHAQLASDVALPASVRTQTTQQMFLCRIEDERWTIGPSGSTFTLSGLRGLHYLRHLVARPGLDVSALDLSDAATGHAGTRVAQRDFDDVLDATAKAAYRQRLRELDDDIAEADSWSDLARREHCERERDAVIAELAAAVGMSGRSRTVGASGERARVAVRKAVATALKQIEAHDASLARLLLDTVHTGANCRYEPDPSRPVDWILEQPR